MSDDGILHIRCLHVDADQPPLDGDDGEFHRRCTARFPWAPRDLPDDQQHLAAFCPYHRIRYAGSDVPATRAEVAEARRRLDRLAERMTMPPVQVTADMPSEPTAEELAAAEARKRRLLADAAEHGLLDPEESLGVAR